MHFATISSIVLIALLQQATALPASEPGATAEIAGHGRSLARNPAGSSSGPSSKEGKTESSPKEVTIDLKGKGLTTWEADCYAILCKGRPRTL